VVLGGMAGAVACRPDGTAGPHETTPGTTPLPPGPHNIVYLYVDQHRGGMAGCFGHPLVQTPNIDALSLESVRYPNMFTNSPLCRPSRATMMTGRLPHVHGCWDNDLLANPLEVTSHVERIRTEAGYATAIFGKAHLTDTIGHPAHPDNVAKLQTWGFDEVLELLSQVMCGPPGNIPNSYSDWLRSITPSGAPDKATLYGDYVSRWEHIEGNEPPDIAPWFITTEENVDLWCAGLAADWIRAYSQDKPFYLQVTLPGPHTPFDSTTEFRALYDANDPLLDTAILEVPSNPSRLVSYLLSHKDFGDITAAQSRALLQTYYAKITMIDEAIGRVIAALEERGMLDNTWVVYSSDHGELVGDHMLWGKVAMYEGAIRVPLVIRPPGGVDGWSSEGLVDQLDVTATLLGMAGLDNQAAGSSRLTQIVEGPDGASAQTGKTSITAEVVGELVGTNYRTAMVRNDRYKLVIDLDTGLPSDFYDLEADPDELTNLFEDPAQRVLIDGMFDEYESGVEADATLSG
jgi:choline-sulfatase